MAPLRADASARMLSPSRSPALPCPPLKPTAPADPSRQGMAYWEYTLNELGIFDVAAQVDKLHEVKMQVRGTRQGGEGERQLRAPFKWRGLVLGCTPQAGRHSQGAARVRLQRA
jgi:hypothetical protein